MSELTPSRRAENLRLIEEIRKYSWWNIPHEHQSAGNRLAHDLPLYEAALAEAEKQLADVQARYENLLTQLGD